MNVYIIETLKMIIIAINNSLSVLFFMNHFLHSSSNNNLREYIKKRSDNNLFIDLTKYST